MSWRLAFLKRHPLPILGTLTLLAVVFVLWKFAALQPHLWIVGALGLGLSILALLWEVPKWQASRPDLAPKERFEVENEARKTLAQIVGGAAVLAGLYFTWGTLEVNREGHITDRFTRAIEQLGHTKLEVRLGGIYALERIARDSEKDYWPILEILTTYVRANAPWPSKDSQPRQSDKPEKGKPSAEKRYPLVRPAVDIQAILTVLGRRQPLIYGKEYEFLDLQETDLRGAELKRAHLTLVLFSKANLEDAFLVEAHLEAAMFMEARLEGAIFAKAYMKWANFYKANLVGADLTGANLKEADLTGADLRGAFLTEAHLEGAKGLTFDQLATVSTLYQARLDPPLKEQIAQKYPQLLEKPW